MSRLSRGLHVAYGALLVWLAYCAVISARNGAPWACVAFVAGAGLAVTAAIREGDLDNARAEPKSRPRNAIDETTAVALAAACCERWWTSAGADHEPACPNYQHRSAA